MATYKIIKGYSGTRSGRDIVVWHVVDAADGYVYDTFSLRRDAAAWVAKAKA